MNDYKPNSHKFKNEQREALEEKAKVEKVVMGTAKIKKKNELRKFANIFLSEDRKDIKSYVINDVIVPTIKKTIISALDMALNGGSSTYDKRGSAPKVSYRKFYDDPRDERRPVSNSGSRFDYDDIVFETRGDAEAVRMQMEEVIERYGFVTVADLYDMAELSAPFTSNKYGWTNISTAESVRLRDGGYILKLPRACVIE